MSNEHTPAQAAKIANVSRTTVSRACKSGKLAARNTNQGWKIKDQDLREWMGDRVQRTSAVHVHDRQDMNLIAEMAELKTENRMLKDQLEELRTERDDWKSQASRRWYDFLRRR